ncbi:MAG TPA: hypothetical protein VHP82_04140 [Gaiellaceae bacterium]|jgi:hypothetical protein|nr:hypothetical protein [Gaiellaceae bacterium]
MKKTVLLVALVVCALDAGVVWAAGGAKGKLCGASGCVALPATLALQLSERNDTFSSESTPKPSPYYKIVIQATGEGHTSRTILWVPSKKLWFDAEDVTPPIAGYWRTARATYPALAALTTKVRLFPAPKRWTLPHY